MMKNKVSFWPFFLSICVLGLAGFWGIAYWSSPEQSSTASRSMASLSTVKLLKLAKQGKSLPQENIKMKKRSPANFSPWFENYREQVYQGRTYFVSKDVYALPEDQYQEKAEVIERRDGHVFFKDPRGLENGHQLWLNPNNNETLIATGRVLVGFEKRRDLHNIQELYGLKVVYQAPGRPLFLMKTEEQKDIDQLIYDLERESGVIKVERELIGPAPQPR